MKQFDYVYDAFGDPNSDMYVNICIKGKDTRSTTRSAITQVHVPMGSGMQGEVNDRDCRVRWHRQMGILSVEYLGRQLEPARSSRGG